LNDEVEHEAWFSEFLGEGPSDHCMRRGETSPWVGKHGDATIHQEGPSRCNGEDGAPTFKVYGGKVYDVSGSFFRQNGRHQVVHPAGDDLTSSLADAPHVADVIGRFPMDGTLKAE
jgi:predicted heme/steroid binding protein